MKSNHFCLIINIIQCQMLERQTGSHFEVEDVVNLVFAQEVSSLGLKQAHLYACEESGSETVTNLASASERGWKRFL